MNLAATLPLEKRRNQTPTRLLYFGLDPTVVDAALKRCDDLVTNTRLTDLQSLERELDCETSGIAYDLMAYDVRGSTANGEQGDALFGFVLETCKRNRVRLVVLCHRGDAKKFENRPDSVSVLQDPISPVRLTELLANQSPALSTVGDETIPPEPSDVPGADSENLEQSSRNADPPAVTRGFELSGRSPANDAGAPAKTNPLMNFSMWLISHAYKKLALVMLTALFSALIFYGIMIVFFLLSSAWSLPFQLSRGHDLVNKMERELSMAYVRRNRLEQEFNRAKTDGKKADRAYRDALSKAHLLEQTIAEERRRIVANMADLSAHSARLAKVETDFKSISDRDQLPKKLESAYKNRVITVTAFEAGTLAALETNHRMALVHHDLDQTNRAIENARVDLEFLTALDRKAKLAEIENLANTESEFADLAAKMIDMKGKIVAAKFDVDLAKQRELRSAESLQVVSDAIESLNSHPASHALSNPVTALFVPYSNVSNFKVGTDLYTCRFGIFWCRQVGKITRKIDGESIAEHPLFRRPMRGIFFEAQFSDPNTAHEELIHAGGPPVLF